MQADNPSPQSAAVPAWTVESWANFWQQPSAEIALARIPKVVLPNVTAYWPGNVPVAYGVEAYCRRVVDMLSMVPDLCLTVQEHASNGDIVFIRWTGQGSGPEGAFECTGVDRFLLSNGRVQENRIISDAAIFAQLAGKTLAT
jgi:predicted SnoaL-like aldol condensation-catalyzing enzyme